MSANDREPIRGVPGHVALWWGAGGFFAVMVYAVARLAPIALDSLAYAWSPVQLAAFLANLVFMAWSEGYRGFQLSYSPRFAARVHALARRADWRDALLAPLIAMGFLYAPRRRVIGAWLLAAAIVVVVLIYRSLPQPWRGILDAGVVVGLGWGILATALALLSTASDGPAVDAELLPRPGPAVATSRPYTAQQVESRGESS